ncbi:MAG: hypothetical protein ABI446_09910 [Gemmatimonadaceae bacterium]
MPIVSVRTLITLTVLGAAAAALSSCKKPDSASDPQALLGKDSSAGSAAANAAGEKTPDPCTLLSANEAEVYVGVLGSPPYRATDDGVADVSGNVCMYRGTDGRQITLDRIDGGGSAGQAISDVPNAVSGALEKAGAGDLAATTHRVMANVPNGPWDHATWIPGGSMMVTKGDLAVNIDMTGASGKEADAVAIAKQIVPRFDHPLEYDGAKAVASAPKPKAHPDNACDVIPKSAVEAAIGTLDGDPTQGTDGSECDYKVASAQGPRTYKVGYTWQGGQKGYNMLKHGMSTMGSVMGGSIPTTGMDNMKMDANTSKMIGGLMKMAGGGGPGAPGAATQVGFKTDTMLKGPWDNASLLHGTQLMAVKSDVMVSMDLQTADYEKAKALLAAICSRL